MGTDKKNKRHRRIRAIWMVLIILLSLLSLSMGLITIDERVAAVALGEESRTTLPHYDSSGQTTGRILGVPYTVTLPPREAFAQAGAWVLQVSPPALRLFVAGALEVGDFIPGACESVWEAVAPLVGEE